MKRELLICICALTVVNFVDSTTNACCEDPVASFSVNPDTVCVGCTVDVDAGDSYDPDGTDLTYEWDFNGDGTPDANKESTSLTYTTAGVKNIKLTVTDNDDPCCCTGCNDRTNDCNSIVTVVEVSKIVEYGTTDQGPLEICLNDYVYLGAIPNPNDASFPSGEQTWSIVSQPSGADAKLELYYGGIVAALYDLTVEGDYVVDACCGSFDTGDSITVTVSQDNPGFQAIDIRYKASFGTGFFSTEDADPCQFEDALWTPPAVCWCTHETSENNKYEHCHFDQGFPFSCDVDNDGDNETITADHCKAWFDLVYVDYDFVAAASCERNCHGYSTGINVWINGAPMGEYVLEDDYTELFGGDIINATIYTKGPPDGNPTHSVKIIEWKNGKIKHTKEKNNESPVYEKVYDPPGLTPKSSWRYWKPEGS